VPKQKYRLQPVLDLRDKAKQAAARLVATRREQLSAAEAELALRKQAVLDCRMQQASAQQKMAAAASRVVAANTLVKHRTHLADLRDLEQQLVAKVDEQKLVVAGAEAELEKALDALIEASREVQVIEKHRETWQQRTRKEEQLKEQKIGDEIGAVTHRRSKSED
jgi:flagellar export protein FliJ